MTNTVLGPNGKEYPSGDLEPLKSCAVCHSLKVISEFYVRRNGKPEGTCKNCRKTMSNARYHGEDDVVRRARDRQRVVERQAKVKELFEQGVGSGEIALQIGVARSTVSNDLQVLGLNKTKRDARLARRARVGELHATGMELQRIAQELGISRSTVTADVRELGRSGERRHIPVPASVAPVKANVKVADRAIEQMFDLAVLFHDGRTPVLSLEGLTIDAEMASLWEKRLTRVGQAVRYLRNHARKGTNNDED